MSGLSTQSVVKGGLHSSANYTWNDADLLGRGATADVYLGRKKETGDLVAVKQFRTNVMFGQTRETEKREFELLRKIDHKNIITLFSIERQTLTGLLVIIMEYCEGGSLHGLLDQPQYNYGLPEDLFLLVLDNVVSGIKYLNTLGIVHRDIKPGNIMRCFQENGDVLFKLTDFGAARELREEENFTSLYGTEEYLLPAMYERAVLHLPTGQNFDSKVDLWSLGVTFYHCAVGKLPFLPYGGRSNRETMFKIISQKDSGVISGVQYFENGPIHWSRELPQTCLLSRGLKSSLIALLSGLMEKDQYKMLTHEKLFDIANNICSKVAFKIFHYATCSQLTVYVRQHDTFPMLKDNIAAQTEIPAQDQVLLLPGGRKLDFEIDQLAPVSSYPKVILSSQLYVFNCTDTENQELKFHDMPSFPDFSSTFTDFDRDAKLAFQSCSRANFMKTVVGNIVTMEKCLVEGEYTLRSYICQKSLSSGEIFLGVERTLLQSKKRFSLFFTLLEKLETLLKKLNLPCFDLSEMLQDKTILTVHEKAIERKNDISKYKVGAMEKLGELSARNMSWLPVCDEQRCLQTASHWCESINTTLGRFRRDRNVRAQMSEHDEKIHIYEREKLEKLCTKLWHLVEEHCLCNLQIMFSQAKPSLYALVKAHTRLVKIERNVDSVMDCQTLLSSRLDKLIERVERLLDCLVDTATTTTSSSQQLPSKDEGYQTTGYQDQMGEIFNDTTDITRMVQESSQILEKFQTLLNQPLFSIEK